MTQTENLKRQLAALDRLRAERRTGITQEDISRAVKEDMAAGSVAWKTPGPFAPMDPDDKFMRLIRGIGKTP